MVELFIFYEGNGAVLAKREPLGHILKSNISQHKKDQKDRGMEMLIDSTSSNTFATNVSNPDRKIVWEDVLQKIKKKSNPQVFFWFSPLKLISQNNDKIILEANSQFDADWINNHYLDFICETINEVNYNKSYDVKIIAKTDGTSVQNDESETKRSKKRAKQNFVSGFLNQNYTFDKFIVGPSNQFAHAASIAVARKPAESYNPLFIYGGVGLGKTHLINAIGNYILKSSPSRARIYNISAEHFTNEVINSIKANKMEDFRNRYRFGCDILLIDDIQFIAGKESTQEEFFHTFNTLYEYKKQIVLTSDKSPKEMSYLEERLRSRFEWGLITDIQPPETETKVAILKKKAESENIVLPNEVSIYMAQNITSNVRELEGTLNNIIAYAKLLNTSITIDLAKEVFKNINKDEDIKILGVEFIQKEVSSYFGLKIVNLKSNKKQKNITFPRQIAMFLARKYTGASYPEIGEKFGGKDHSTVIHAVRKIESLLPHDPTLRKTIENISNKIETIRRG